MNMRNSTLEIKRGYIEAGVVSMEDIERICRNAGFRAVERDTHYNEL